MKHARARPRCRLRWSTLAAAAFLAICSIPATPAFIDSEPAGLRLSLTTGDAEPVPVGPVVVRLPEAGALGIPPALAKAAAPTPTIAAPEPGPWRATSLRSGLPWASGAWGENEPGGVREWGAWRGRPADVATWWVDRSSWRGMTDFSVIADGGFPTYAVGIPPFPEDSGGSLKACAAGDYDRRWVEIGNAIAAAGLENRVLLRLGWEFDGDWYEWSATNPAAFAQCWRRVVVAAESVAPGLHWAWNVSRGPNHISADSIRAYPGDEYVDTIGVDSSDFYPPATDERSWNEHLNGDHGLNFWLEFAASHHKSLSIPEWGNVSGTQDEAGHDNPFYIQKMHEFFAQHAERIGYEAYFDTTERYWRSELMNAGTDLPRAAATYRQLWGPRGPDIMSN